MKDFAEIEKIKENRQFLRLYSRGKKRVNPVIVIYYLKNKNQVCMLGITTGKKIGNAVKRNRARRKIKEAFSSIYKENKDRLSGYTFVLVARVKTINLKSYEIKAEIEKELKKAAII